MGSNMGSPVRTQTPLNCGAASSDAPALLAAESGATAAVTARAPANRLKTKMGLRMGNLCVWGEYTGFGRERKTTEILKLRPDWPACQIAPRCPLHRSYHDRTQEFL